MQLVPLSFTTPLRTSHMRIHLVLAKKTNDRQHQEEAIGKNAESIKNDKGVHPFKRHILRINAWLFTFRVCIIINACLALET